MPTLMRIRLVPIENIPAATQDCCVPTKPRLDDIDHELLALLQHDAGRTLFDLGDAVGLSASAVQRLIKRLEQTGVIARRTIVLGPAFTADVILAVCLVTMERHIEQHSTGFRERLLAAPEVQQAYDVSGDWDYVIVLATVDMSRMREAVERLFEGDDNVRRVNTLFVFDPVRTGNAIPTRP